MIDNKKVLCGEFVEITRIWSGTNEIIVNFEFETEIVKRPENMVCIRRGPLFYSLPINEKWERVEYTESGVERKYPFCDYYIYPQSKWNYGLASDKFDIVEQEYDMPFYPENPPISIMADMFEIEWDFNNGHCDRLPKSIIPIGNVCKMKLIPYGCTNLRMTEIPFVKK